jgi:hypothetical protein
VSRDQAACLAALGLDPSTLTMRTVDVGPSDTPWAKPESDRSTSLAAELKEDF